MATQFVCTINKTGNDYSTLSGWEAAVQTNLTLASCKVIAGSLTRGAIGDAVAITQTTSGATAVCKHHSATQMLVAAIVGVPDNNHTWYPSADLNDTTNAWTPTDAGDSAILVAECYDDSHAGSGLDDLLAIDGSTTSATNYILVTVAAGERHDGTLPTGSAGDGFLLKHDWNGTDNSNVIYVADNYVTVEWVAIQMLATGTCETNSGIHLLDCQYLAIVQRCIVTATLGAGDSAYAYRASGTTGATTWVASFYVCIAYNVTVGFRLASAASRVIDGVYYNNTVWGCGTGFQVVEGSGGTTTVLLGNNLVNDCTTDYSVDAGSAINAASATNITNDTPAAADCFGVVADSGTTDDAAANKLKDSDQNFLTTVKVGMIVKNTTDSTYTYVTAVDSDGILSVADDIFADAEAYSIYTNICRSVTFVNEGAGTEDLHLDATETLAIDRGTDLGTGSWSFDIDGRDRDGEGDTWDIGADEYVSAAGGQQYDETARVQTLLMVQAAAEAQGYSEAGSQTLLLSQALGDCQGYSEGLSQTIQLVQAAAQVQGYVEPLAQTLLLEQLGGETQGYAEALLQTILAVHTQRETQGYAEGRAQTLLLTQTVQETQAYVESLAQTLQLTQAVGDTQGYVEALAQVLQLVQALTDSMPVQYNETGLSQIIYLTAALTESLTQALSLWSRRVSLSSAAVRTVNLSSAAVRKVAVSTAAARTVELSPDPRRVN